VVPPHLECRWPSSPWLHPEAGRRSCCLTPLRLIYTFYLQRSCPLFVFFFPLQCFCPDSFLVFGLARFPRWEGVVSGVLGESLSSFRMLLWPGLFCGLEPSWVRSTATVLSIPRPFTVVYTMGLRSSVLKHARSAPPPPALIIHLLSTSPAPVPHRWPIPTKNFFLGVNG
jgi:hypothetical protein